MYTGGVAGSGTKHAAVNLATGDVGTMRLRTSRRDSWYRKKQLLLALTLPIAGVLTDVQLWDRTFVTASFQTGLWMAFVRIAVLFIEQSILLSQLVLGQDGTLLVMPVGLSCHKLLEQLAQVTMTRFGNLVTGLHCEILPCVHNMQLCCCHTSCIVGCLDLCDVGCDRLSGLTIFHCIDCRANVSDASEVPALKDSWMR